jgi:hypothetical protein
VLEVHAEVGDEHAGADEHRARLSSSDLAEAERLDLDDVVAGLGERNADDLERARVAAGELRQRERVRASASLASSDTSRVPTILSTRRRTVRPLAFFSSTNVVQSRSVKPSWRALSCVSWYRCTRAYQARMSASLSSRLTRTCPPPAWLAPAAGGRSSLCTWRKVTGSIASAFFSMIPNGAAANLAIGGALPVCTLSGNADRLASGRPAMSFIARASRPRRFAFSASGRNATSVTSPDLSSLSNTGRAPRRSRASGAAAPRARARPAR